MICSAGSFFPRGIECPPLVFTLTESLWKWCRYKGGRLSLWFLTPFLTTSKGGKNLLS